LGEQQADLGLIVDFSEHLVDCALSGRMDEQRIEFAQGHEYEPALMEARMRDGQSRLIDHPPAIEQDVEVDCSGT
jgi:hypothetical protein